ncbi:MAG TPA: hypothetical protein VKA70_05395 [Blastocatellia bacterium]|nr:hypothetical protein [Blastocatellia bacterium]
MKPQEAARFTIAYKRSFVILIAAALLGWQAPSAASQNQQPIPVLEGLDPVMLVKGKEVQGEFNIAVTRGRFQYLFANEENKAAFEKEPSRYEIQLGGACARMGAPVGGNPDLYTVYKERVYIFGSEACKNLFQSSPEKYLESEETSQAPTADAIKKGQSLIEKAVSAMGGAARLDALASYQEQRRGLQHRNSGDVEIKYVTTVAFPNRSRQEEAGPDYKQVIVLTPSESFGFSPDSQRPAVALPDMVRQGYEKQIARNPLVILKNRKQSGFKAAAVGTDKVGDIAVEQVEVETNGLKVKLGIDAATGRVMSLSYRGRGPGGAVGQITRTYSDFRTVDGLLLPFKVVGAFNGDANSQVSTTIDSITVNGQIAPAAFEKPKTGGAQ